jgi:hypothetical protein
LPIRRNCAAGIEWNSASLAVLPLSLIQLPMQGIRVGEVIGVGDEFTGARAVHLAATYLAWVDFPATGLAPEAVAGTVKSRARIFASPGAQFGAGGDSWLRFNFATPRPILAEALARLENAFADLRSARKN